MEYSTYSQNNSQINSQNNYHSQYSSSCMRHSSEFSDIEYPKITNIPNPSGFVPVKFNNIKLSNNQLNYGKIIPQSPFDLPSLLLNVANPLFKNNNQNFSYYYYY